MWPLAEHIVFGHQCLDGSIGSLLAFCIPTSCQWSLLFASHSHFTGYCGSTRVYSVRFNLDAKTKRWETQGRKEALSMETERTDDIPLLLTHVQRMQVAMLLDKHVPTHGLRKRTEHGRTDPGVTGPCVHAGPTIG
jgi:hypothetical protein